MFGIIGLSGAGKIPWWCINYLEVPTSGKVVLKEKPVQMKDRKASGQQSMGMIFQQFNLLSQKCASKRMLPLEIAGIHIDQAKKRAESFNTNWSIYIERIGMKKYPAQLSGGQNRGSHCQGHVPTGPQAKRCLCDKIRPPKRWTPTRPNLFELLKINQEMGITVIVIAHEGYDWRWRS